MIGYREEVLRCNVTSEVKASKRLCENCRYCGDKCTAPQNILRWPDGRLEYARTPSQINFDLDCDFWRKK